MLFVLVFMIGVLGVGIWFYNRLVSLRNLLKEALSGIDVQLKRRHDLVPNLVEVVKGYRDYEKGLLERVTLIRSQVMAVQSPLERLPLESSLVSGLRSLLAIAEAYPDLKANQQFLSLQNALVKVEDELQMARRYYNGTVRDYNTCVQSFPGNMIAAKAGFQVSAFFEIEYATERVTPDMNF